MVRSVVEPGGYQVEHHRSTRPILGWMYWPSAAPPVRQTGHDLGGEGRLGWSTPGVHAPLLPRILFHATVRYWGYGARLSRSSHRRSGSTARRRGLVRIRRYLQPGRIGVWPQLTGIHEGLRFLQFLNYVNRRGCFAILRTFPRKGAMRRAATMVSPFACRQSPCRSALSFSGRDPREHQDRLCCLRCVAPLHLR